MKDKQKEDIKVSLIFYSEEEGKRVKMDKWDIEIGKKYTIGRSKKKADISIQDITISRIQGEFIFYDKNRIMIKDFNSSNGTYINKVKIDPYLEVYFSIKDILSIGDEKNEFVFEISKEMKRIEEQKINKKEDFDFDEIKQNNKSKPSKEYLTEKNKKNSSKSNSIESSYEKLIKRKNKYDIENKYEKNDDKYKYNIDESYKNEENYYKKNKYEKEEYKNENDKEIIFDKEDKFIKRNKYKYNKDNKFKYDRNDNKKKSKKRSKDRFSTESYHLKDKNKKKSNEFRNDEKEEKNKYKNISSYIIKKDNMQEEEIERENNKRQITLYNEYLELKKEKEEKLKQSKLPTLLPVLISRPKEESSYSDEEESQEENEIDKLPYKIRPRVRSQRKRIMDSYANHFIGIKRRGPYMPKYRKRQIKGYFYN